MQNKINLKKIIENNYNLRKITAKLLYKKVKNLIYYKNIKYGLRLYILKLIVEKVFKLAYDELNY